MKQTTFLESYAPGEPLAEAQVDGLVIHNVSLLGRTSLNNRVYREQAMSDAVRLYDGAPVYIDHPAEGELAARGGIRSAHDFAGRIRNVRKVGDRVRGDLEILDREPTKGLLLAVAKQMPEQAGMSHRARGELTRGDDGTEYVESLTAVSAVEFVMEPATVAGLFESVRAQTPVVEGSDEDRRSQLQTAISKRFDTWGEYLWVDAVYAEEGYVVFSVSEGPRAGLWRVAFGEGEGGTVTLGDLPEKVRRVTTFEPTESKQPHQESDMKDITLEALRAERPDLITAITESVRAELAKTDEVAELTTKLTEATARATALETEKTDLTAKLDESQTRERLRDRKDLVERKLTEAALPEGAVTERFRTVLMNAVDEAAVDAEIAERKALAEAVKVTPAGQPPKQPPSDRVADALDESKKAPVTDGDIQEAAGKLFG